jgi:curli biogenesis system outer membrane secretion channel CsgG
MTRLNRVIRVTVLAGFVPLASGCAAAIPAMVPVLSQALAKASSLLSKKPDASGPTIEEAVQEAYDGPKARVGISRFAVKAAGAQNVVGDGLADMLATALFQSNRFVVLERQLLGDILAEQDFGASGRVKGATAAQQGEIEGAELLVTGTVTEFDPGSAVFGAGVGSALGSSLGSSLATSGGYGYSASGYLVGAALGQAVGSLQTSHVAIDMRLIDARTSRIVAATTVQGQAVDFAGGGWSGGTLAGGLAGFSKTPMEKAIRVAVQEAVRFVTAKTPAQYFHHRDASVATAPPSGASAASFASEGRMANPVVRTAASAPAPADGTREKKPAGGYIATYRLRGTSGDEASSLSCEILLDGASITASEPRGSESGVVCTAVASRD